MAAGGLLEKSAVGKRESLSDLIAVADVRQCPFSSMLTKAAIPVKSAFHEWTLDSYANPKTAGQVDGVDVTDFENAQENVARTGAYIHYFRRTGKVSKMAQEVATIAGEKNPIGYARKKKLEEIKRDKECVYLSDGEMQQDDGTVGYQTRGMGVWIQATAQTISNGVIPAAHRPTAAQINTTATASLVEDTDIQGMLQAIFDATGMKGDFKLFAGSTLRRRFTDMTRTVANANNTASKVRTFTGTQSDEKISNTTTIYEGDYGDIEIITCPFIAWTVATAVPDKNRGYVADMDKIEEVQYLLPDIVPLADEGGGPRFYIDAWTGLKVLTPRGMGKFAP